MQEKITKLLLGLGVVAALVVGGTQLAGAQGTKTTTPPAATRSGHNDGQDASDAVSAADAAKAKVAALAKVPGTVTEVSAEHEDAADRAEKPDAGEPADPAYEAQIAYDVEVTKADGSAVDVHLDKAFTVLGTSAAHQDQHQDQGDAED
jgi:uncharacterized membrane protein YkoI